MCEINPSLCPHTHTVYSRITCVAPHSFTMEVFPGDIQWLVWRTFFSRFVVGEIQRTYNFRWKDPSQMLIDLCKDLGTIQQGHHELEDMIRDENMWAWKICSSDRCANCEHFGFPCTNLAHFGFNNEKLECLWQPNFT